MAQNFEFLFTSLLACYSKCNSLKHSKEFALDKPVAVFRNFNS